MAMSLKGKNRHYLWSKIQKRHWLAMAKQCEFPADEMQKIMDDVFEHMDSVIEQVTKVLPKRFPQQISEAIFNGMRKVKGRF